jgi:hypothetical protein
MKNHIVEVMEKKKPKQTLLIKFRGKASDLKFLMDRI